MAVKKAAVKRQHEVNQLVSVEKTSGRERHRETTKNEIKKIPMDSLQDIQNPAYVRLEHSATKNMQNFESLRVVVAIEMPCQPTPEKIQETYDFMSKRVETLMLDEMELVQSSGYLTV